MEHLILLSGDGKYLPFARSRIKALRATGLEYASQQFEIEGGSVKVRITPGHEYITLSGSIYQVLSGVIKGGEIIEIPPPEGSPEGTAPTKTLRNYKPTLQAWTYPLKEDPAKSPSAFNDEPRLAVEAHTDLPITGSQYADLTPSMYSGLMAKAVQIIMGYGKQTKVRYDFRWSRCHGIVTAADSKLWLLEISTDNGVISKPLPILQNTKGLTSSAQDVLREAALLFGGLPSGGVFPTGDALTAALASGDVLRLKTPEEMDAFFSKSPYATTMGWSFNPLGSEAHNTCYSTDGTDFTGHHYKLEIAIGAMNNPRTSGGPLAPASATLSLVSEGPLTQKQFHPGGVYTSMQCYFYDELLGAEFVIPGRLVPYEEPSPDYETPLIACHINGVLEVVSIKTRAVLEYSYLATGPDRFMGPYTVTETSLPVGMSIIYPGYDPVLDGYSLSKYGEFTPVASNDDGIYTYTAFRVVGTVRTAVEQGFVTWGGAARDCYKVFRTKADVSVATSHTGYSFNYDSYDLFGGDPNDYISLTHLSSSGGFDYIGMPASTPFAQVPAVITRRYPISFYIGNGTPIDFADDIVVWEIPFMRVTYSVFGLTPNSAYTFEGYYGFTGPLLATEPTAPEKTKYTFIGYT